MLASLLIAQAFAAGARRKFILPGGEVVFGEEEARTVLLASIPEEIAYPKTRKERKVARKVKKVWLRTALREAEVKPQRDDEEVIFLILSME